MKEKRVLSLSYGKIVLRPADKLRGLVPESFETYQVVDPGDIVLRTTDLQNDHTSLRVGLVRDRGIITSAYLALKVKDDVLPAYGYQVLNVWDITKTIYAYGSGLRQNLDFSHFKRLPIALPPLDEQKAIIRFLDHANRRIDRFIRAKRKLIALLNEQKQAIIHQAITRGVDSGVQMKDSAVPGLGEIPKHWETVPLKSLCLIQSGVTLGKQYTNERVVELPYLRVANVQAGRLNLAKVTSIQIPRREAQRFMLRRGDVLMTEGGDPDKLGRGCVWNEEISPCLHQNHIFAVRPSLAKLLPRFLSAILGSQYAKEYFLRAAKQTTNLASTNRTTIGRFRLPLPDINEQHRILDAMEADFAPLLASISQAEREIALIREYRTRLIADVVTGQLDVREAAARLPAEDTEPLDTMPLDEEDDEEALDDEADAMDEGDPE